MIPRDPSKPYRYTDEKSGVVYLFQYLTDENEDRFQEICDLSEKARSSGKEFVREMYRKTINLFLVGWENFDLPFPTDGNPSKCFIGGNLYKMGKIVNDLIPELCGLDIDEAKN